MISIQELGLSILGDQPKQFYVLGGVEYGVKDKYIDRLTEFYHGEKYEYPTVKDVIDTMNVRHLIPLKPSLYIVRYDESFVTSINQVLADKIRSTKIVGTLVCIYSDEKHVAKIDKYLPEYTGQIDAVNPKFIEKYLKQDFPKLSDRLITLATKCAANYGHARNICKSLSNADPQLLGTMKDSTLEHLFGCSNQSVENDFRLGIASRNFNFLVKSLELYESDKTQLYYTILQTMIDMEKVLISKYPNVDIAEYKKFWKIQDIYYMFMNTFQELSNSRSSNVSTSIDSSLIYLFALLTFKDIPAPEVINSDI